MNSFRFKLQVSFVALGLLAIAATGWQAWRSSAAALRDATEDRLTAIRETKRQMLETYFRDVSNHVLALSSDEATILALESLRTARAQVPQSGEGSEAWTRLRSFYHDQFAPSIAHAMPAEELMSQWPPTDPRTVTLQDTFISNSPHPVGSKDLLLDPPGLGAYGAIHARFHPTFHRYQNAFGFYDIFVIDAHDGRILYSVFKETDFDHSLDDLPYSGTALASVYRKAMEVDDPDVTVTEDYARYIASHFAPAAFVGAPIWRAGAKTGVLVIQVSAEVVNHVISGSGNWQREGLGDSGNAYLLGTDGLLRSDLRFFLEDQDAFLEALRGNGLGEEAVQRMRLNRTSILNLSLDPGQAKPLLAGGAGTGLGTDFRGVEVIRSYTPLEIPGLSWWLVAEMSRQEAFEPLRQLSLQTITVGLVVAILFLVSAWWLGDSVTKPVLRLAEGARRLGERDFGVHLPVTSSDELGDLAIAFNRMATNLEKTTVSRDELKTLAKLLIETQELERNSLSRELHDDFTQRLAALAIRAGRLKNAAQAQQSEILRGELDEIQQGLSRISRDVHRMSRRLHPSILDDLGLVAAIENECRGFFERGGPVVDLEIAGELNSLPKETQIAIYRIVQEGLTNISRHAGATEVEIALRRENGSITLSIHDNGAGFSRESAGWKPGLGLASMAERARLLGGQLEVKSRPGEGTGITMTIPEEVQE